MGTFRSVLKVGLICLCAFFTHISYASSSSYKDTYTVTKEYPYSTNKKYAIKVKDLFTWTVNFSYKVKIIDRASKQNVYKFIIEGLCLSHHTFKFSPDGNYLFVQPDFHPHKLIDIKNKKIVFDGNKQAKCDFSPDGQFLCLEHQEKVQLICAKSFEKIKEWSGKQGKFSSDNNIFSLESNKKKITYNLLGYRTKDKLKKKLFKFSKKKLAIDAVVNLQYS